MLRQSVGFPMGTNCVPRGSDLFLFCHERNFMLSLSESNHIPMDKNSKWVWSGNSTITNYRQTSSTVRKSQTTIIRHQENKKSKATSSLFPIKMIE